MTPPQVAPAAPAQSTRRRLPLYALFGANAISSTGDVLTFLAIPWFVLQSTGSVAQTGLTAFFYT
ncbi:MAG: MFS transporter, partial [Ktedonobacterales bacterium]